MAKTDIAQVQNQIQSFWAPVFMKELRESLLLGALVNKEYQGEIKAQGDTVKISQMNAPTGQLLTVGSNADSFASEQMSWEQVSIQANKRAVASFDVVDLAQLQSQLDSPNGQSEMRASLLFAVQKQINDYLWSLVNPSTSAPDHLITGNASLDATDLLDYRELAAVAKWSMEKGWYGLLSPAYYSDLLAAQTLTSRDYVEGETPVIGGQLVNKRFGFSLLEDNSRTSAKGLFFHPDFMHMVMQKEVQFKISDKHPLGQFGYKISADVIFGAGLGIDGSVKHIYTTSGSSLDAAQ